MAVTLEQVKAKTDQVKKFNDLIKENPSMAASISHALTAASMEAQEIASTFMRQEGITVQVLKAWLERLEAGDVQDTP